jgi:hypothetical protein
MGRSVFAVLAGYLVFGLSAAILFGLSRVDPHQPPSTGFAVGSVAYGVFFAAIAGYVAAALAPGRARRHAAILAGIIAGIALVSLILNLGSGSVWSELATALLMAPAVLVGGHLRASLAA